MIETERLLLRRPTEADVESPPAWLSDPEVMDWLGGIESRRPRSCSCGSSSGNASRRGSSSSSSVSDGAVVGRVGANYYDVQTWRRSADGEPELGWALGREYWGHGYATEAALAVREWLRAPRVISLIAPDNLRSQQVAQRLGARPEQTVELPGYGPHQVWVHPR